jgi:hypothetical protein
MNGCGSSSGLLPIHNCVQTALENDYFKEKLTEFYKENKKLKQQLAGLKTVPVTTVDGNENSTPDVSIIKTERVERSCQTTDEAKQLKSMSSSLIPRPIVHFASGKCSVCCSQRSGKKPSLNTRSRQCQTEPLVDKPLAPQVVDKDAYNKQNKVWIYNLVTYEFTSVHFT